MKKSISVFATLFIHTLVTAQIGEVKVSGNQAKIYDGEGRFTHRYVDLSSGYELVGYNSKYIVVRYQDQARIYDSDGKYTYKYAPICNSCKLVNVGPTAILIKQGNMTKYYDFEGKYTNKYTYD